MYFLAELGELCPKLVTEAVEAVLLHHQVDQVVEAGLPLRHGGDVGALLQDLWGGMVASGCYDGQ